MVNFEIGENKMHMIAVVMLLNVMINPVDMGATTFEEYHANFRTQFEQPVIVVEYNFN